MNNEINILLVENNKENIRLVNQLAEGGNFRKLFFSVADNIPAVDRKLSETSPDILLLNPAVTGNSDFETIRFIKHIRQSFPVIIVLNNHFPENRINQLLDAGADDFLILENINPELFYHTVSLVLMKKKSSLSLLRTEDNFQLIVRHFPILIYEQTKDLVYKWVYSPVDSLDVNRIIGKKDSELLPVEDALILTEVKRRVLETGIETRKIIRITYGGSVRYFDLKIEPVLGTAGNVEGIRCSSLDITDRKTVEHEFHRAKDLLERIFFSLNEAVLLLDLASMKIITCNPAVQKILGYTTQEIIGHSMEMMYVNREDFEKYENISRQILPQKGLHFLEQKMKCKDGRLIDTEHRVTLLKKNRGWNEMAVAVINDITERKNIEHALIKARDNAEKSDRLKTEFLAQMSHEIRTPVNIMLSYTRLIESELQNRLPEDLKNSFQAIDKAGIRIIRTIDLLLNLSEVVTGNYEKVIRQIDVYLDIILKLYIENKKLIAGRNIEMHIDKLTENTEISADEYSATQIFSNLIENAVKYTNEGKIGIIIRRNDRNELVVEITDTGIGISDEYLPDLFQPFSQEHKGYTRIFEGNGLGLALVKKYCELNNASINVESRKGYGSKFIVTFPASS